jgi:DNA-binding NarL/FixJ family response regulator
MMDRMTSTDPVGAHQETLDRLRQVRDEALAHARRARELAAERRDIIRQLLDAGLSQADIGRELGVSRQAIQKMLAI